MENTLENKAKFFAQYWGQEVFEWKYPENSIKEGIIVKHPDLLNYSGCLFLQLKSLSDIKDEDAVEAIKKLSSGYYGKSVKDFDFQKRKASFSSEEFKQVTTDNYFYLRTGHVVANFSCDGTVSVVRSNRDENYLNYHDYLRSKGYALPYNGLSVEKQIEYGWVKLQATN